MEVIGGHKYQGGQLEQVGQWEVIRRSLFITIVL